MRSNAREWTLVFWKTKQDEHVLGVNSEGISVSELLTRRVRTQSLRDKHTQLYTSKNSGREARSATVLFVNAICKKTKYRIL